MEKLDVMGICSYYQKIPFGAKDSFVMELADAIGQSTSSVRRKIKDGSWRKSEIAVVTKFMKSR
jgi:hypothetical protein